MGPHSRHHSDVPQEQEGTGWSMLSEGFSWQEDGGMITAGGGGPCSFPPHLHTSQDGELTASPLLLLGSPS